MPVEVVSHIDEIKERHHAALSDAVGAMGQSFLVFTLARFQREGDGWKELADYTNEEREWLGFPTEHPILKRLGVLEGALIRGNDGNLFEHVETRVTVGISGGQHPGYETPGGDVIYADAIENIALMHQTGAGRPQRPIFVYPDEGTINEMTTILVNASTTAIG